MAYAEQVTRQFDSSAFVRRMAAGMARGIAEKVADALDGVVLDNLVKRRDLKETELKRDGHLRETELRPRQELKDLELRLTVRCGVMLAATAALIVAMLGGLITLR